VISYAFHPEAEAEFANAALFYESRVVGLGRLFSAEVRRIVLLLREFPEAGAPIRLPVRRILIDRFPYAVVYRRDEGSIVILAVSHLHRRPGYWRRRK
jgi:toxin ParE1/3/4